MSYPAWWNQDITIYNKYVDPTTHVITWYRKQISGCFWKRVVETFSLGEARLTSEVTIVRVPLSDYMSKDEWDILTHAQKLLTLTFDVEDLIVKGNVADVIDEYTSGKRSNDLVNKYKTKGIIKINSFTDNSDTIKAYPHYCIRGN